MAIIAIIVIIGLILSLLNGDIGPGTGNYKIFIVVDTGEKS